MAIRKTVGQLGTGDLAEGLGYVLKRRMLGKPLVNEELGEQRLSKRLALGVLAPDGISSSAYGTEEILIELLRGGLALTAFTIILPLTGVVLFVMALVVLSYREVVTVYTRAGGSYVVARDNFGPRVAQIAAVALLIDYVVTVAVQVAAGTAAVASAVPAINNLDTITVISIGIVILMCYGNLRGIREAGQSFAVPTYLFSGVIILMIITGLLREAFGTLPLYIPHAGIVTGTPSNSGLIAFGMVFVLLRAFANGGSSLTGIEAVSNAVSAFRPPEGLNARRVLVAEGLILGSLVAGISWLAHVTHARPYTDGVPTVISQEARLVFGHSFAGTGVYILVQAATALILYTGGNTSFNGFPFLASFVAQDAYLPKQLTRRGHRLAFSNGIIVLTVVAVALLIATGAKVSSLVALYAIGVFTGFAMAGAGMVKHHWDNKEAHWRRNVAINAISAFLTALIVLIFATVKFKEGAWVVVVVGPLMYFGLVGLHRQYATEEHQLEEGAAEAAEAPVLNRHVVVVLVDQLDMASARALQYARTLHPDELRAVHFALDAQKSEELEAEWRRLGLAHLPLDVEACEDRRLTRATLELAAETVADHQTELTILLPRRGFAAGWQRVLHDATADQIAAAVAQLPHVNATMVPYQLTGGWFSRRRQWRRNPDGSATTARGARAADRAADREAAVKASFDRSAFGEQRRGTTPIDEAQWRHRVRVAGRVKSVRVQPRAGTSNLECMLVDDTGKLLLVFQGRRRIPGIQPGARLVVEGMVGDWARRQAILNPDYELIAGPEAAVEPT